MSNYKPLWKRKVKYKYPGLEYGTAEYQRASWLKNTFGIDISYYNELFDKQKGCCAVCGRHQSEFKKSLSIDHCHKTMKIRGLLCHNCNIALGHLFDDLTRINNLKNYLEKDLENSK